MAFRRFLLFLPLCFIAILSTSLGQLNAQETHSIYQRAKIYFNGANNLQRLIDLGIYSDHGFHKKDIFVLSAFSTQELEQARQVGFDVEVIIPDLKAHFLEQNRDNQSSVSRNADCVNQGATYPTPANFKLGSMGGYLTYQEVLDELAEMRTLFPNLISEAANISDFLTEGNPDNAVTPSIGGNGIKWVRISDNPTIDEEEPEVLYTSLHHAREPMSLMQNIYFMWYLLENYETDPEIQTIVDNTELYFVPVVNPDGYLYNEKTDPDGGGFWRKNRNGSGVDNNRNYSYHINGDPNNETWGGPGSSPNPSSSIYHGTAPFSEIENQAIRWFTEQHDFIIALNSHTHGRLLFYPFAYENIPTPDEALYIAMGAELTSRNEYEALRDSPFAGDSDDFMYGTVGTHDRILAFTPEIGTAFWPAASLIDATCKEMMYQNITAAQMINNFGKLSTEITMFSGNELALEVPYILQRIGVNGTGNFTITIEAVSDNITNVEEALSINGLAPLETQADSTIITLSPEITIGDPIVFDIILNNGMYDVNERITSFYGSPAILFKDNGDSATVNFESNDWGTTAASFQSPGRSITDSPNGDYENNLNSSIQISENIDLTGATAASISFYTRFDIEPNFDYVQLEISIDNGLSWEPQCTGLTTIGNSDQAEGQPLYHGTLLNWTFEEVNLDQYIGESITARFKLVTDNFVVADGFYFDDLQINVLNPSNLSVGDSAFAKAFAIYPNPVRNTLTIQSQQTQYSITVHSILGQEIIQQNTQKETTNVDLSNLKTGIYFVTLESLTETRSFKIIKE